MEYIRYPGGTICERWFDLSNPDKKYDPATRNGELTPLSEFVDYIETGGHEYALVIPTIRYMEHIKNGGNLNAAKQELETFLTKLRNGEYGGQLPDTIEIGNEYYAYEGAGDSEKATLYGEVARAFSETIRKELGYDIKIGVQAGWNKAENDIILDAFRDADAYVDSVIVHAYPWKLNDLQKHGGLKTWLVSEWEKSGIAETSYLSEWNVSNQYDDDNGVISSDRIERGMAQAVTLLEMAHGYMTAGIDLAAVWPLQQNTPGDLGGDEGQDADTHWKLSKSGLTLVGEAFRLLESSAVGKTVISSPNIDLDGANEEQRFRDEVIVQTFTNPTETVVFASAWALEDDQIGSTISFDLDGGFIAADVVRLGSSASDKLNPNGQPTLSKESYIGINQAKDVEITLDDPYVIYQITYKKILGNYIMGTPGNDARKGSQQSDWLYGFEGDDFLVGGAGADNMRGHAGNDTLRAGKDDDSLKGGAGDDLLIGARGADEIRGSAGADTVRGGKDNDKLSGGKDNDIMFGGRNDDTIRGGKGDDRMNGSLDDDVLKGGGGNDTLISADGFDELTGGGGNDVFHFIHREDERVVITDFNSNEDQLIIRDDHDHGYTARTADGSTIISVGTLDIVLDGVMTFSSSDLMFV